ncbi:flavin-containing monooxygenase [Derxia lacustris]|uniref:flavin-containing monooxygenase n=1 Tax=Derxia lacustris TaxID=764842 RepID=UPI000A1732C0|nr:NAD(P)-binding domain-containing protein [Derxia lacustris]
MQQPSRVCIIGAGASGITVGKTLARAGIDFDIVDAAEDFGGNWQPSGPASKVYESTHLISSRSNTQFSDVPMAADWPAYPRHTLFWHYLKQVAAHYDLQRHARFGVAVERMQAAPGACNGADGWQLQLSDGSAPVYRDVVVCNGLLRKPRRIAYPGEFTGQQLHSGDYKTATMFRGKRVLVIGGGNSGCDIAVDAGQNAVAAFHSTRRGYHYLPKFLDGKPTQEWLMNEAKRFDSPADYWAHVKATIRLAGFDGTAFGLPAPDHDIDQAHPIMNSQLLYHVGHGDVVPKPDVARFDGGRVHFTDGSSADIDVVVHATGFEVSLPFLDKSVVDWTRGLSGIFLHMVPPKHDNLLFFGYLNAPSGYGNVANTTARFIDGYFKARQRQSRGWQVLQQLKLRWNELDLGQDRYMRTERHAHEFDLWKYLATVNFLAAKLAA